MNDNDDDAIYYLARAKEEDEAAGNSANPQAADVHRILASRYRAMATSSDEGPELSVVRD